jgi:C1A family cysteine protease
MNRKYGWKRDSFDRRDKLFCKVTKPIQIPVKVDLRSICPPVQDQGQVGSCSGNALASALEILELKDKVKTYENFSRLFIYYNERMVEDTVNEDAGAMIRDGIKVLAKYGACDEKLWPYNESTFTQKPSNACYVDGLKHIITLYHRITGLQEMLQCLVEGFPFVFGFDVYSGFESSQVANTGILNMPGKGEQSLGGHAVTCVGVCQFTKRFIVRNSWGSNWGSSIAALQGEKVSVGQSRGYFSIPFDYISNPNLADDFWVIHTGEGM